MSINEEAYLARIADQLVRIADSLEDLKEILIASAPGNRVEP